MTKSKYDNYTKEQLIDKIRHLEKLRYGLVWEDKLEDVAEMCEKELPVLHEVEDREIVTNQPGIAPNNILIEGDNYHSLYSLNFTHRKKIDLIYIDPPYNTGSKSWKYNNQFVEKDDPWAHSKWLSMMYKRLQLAKRLLKPKGALIVAIDDYEVHQLGMLLEQVLPTFERDLIIVEHHPQGAGSNTVSRTHEYAFICTPIGVGFPGRQIREEEDNWSLKRSGQGENNWRENRPKQFYSIIVDEEKRKVVAVGPELPKDQFNYPKGKTKEGFLRIYPIDKNGKERVWRYNRETMTKYIQANLIEFTKKGSLTIKKESVNAVPVFSIWKGARYNAGTYGSSLLTQIMGKANTFPYPKSLFTVLDMIKLIVGANKEAIILDFFAGSGTTAHAVLELNKEDAGNRQFILCTNNENKICEEVTYPRIKKVISGYNETKGIQANLKYYKTEFVPQVITDNDKRILVNRSTELLCLAENTFKLVKQSKRKLEFAIFKSDKQYTAIIYDEDAIDKCKEALEELSPKVKTIIYVFSYDHEYNVEDFDGLSIRFSVKPIPEVILNVYRKNSKLRRK